jgi:hypothetical protein
MAGHSRSKNGVASLAFVMRGLDPRIHPLKKMDRRVKPGDDASIRFRATVTVYPARSITFTPPM